MKIGKSGVQIDNPESLIQRLTSATRCADWEAVTAIALCGIYGERCRRIAAAAYRYWEEQC